MSDSEDETKNEDLSEKYKKMSHREHALLRPGMYMGTITNEVDPVWIIEIIGDSRKMVERTLEYNPGILKLVDEIITNASDHAVDKPVKTIKIDVIDNVISVFNDGPGIETVKHPEHGIYIPELIFANFLTSSNYNDKKKRLKGGMNGIGSKIVGTFSTEFTVETVSGGRRYIQTFKNNLTEIGIPKISKYSKSEYTKISFIPDFKRFGTKGISDGTLKIIEKRAYDLAACTDKKVSIYFNGEKLAVRDFKDYTSLYLPEEYKGTKVFIEKDRWKVAIMSSPFDKFTQVSFVNGLYTINGGKHVDHILAPVLRHLTDALRKKNENVKPSYIKDNILMFVISLIENPSFKSQSKEELTTPYNEFGSSCIIDEKYLKTLLNSEICKNVLDLMKYKDSKELNQSDGKKKLKLTGIPKLDDATLAGGKQSLECTLILTEGDSAKTFAVSGTTIIGREKFGIFPLRGKLLNVKTATMKQLSSNEEIKNLKTILGLQNKQFKDVDILRKTLRYGKVLILTDSDHDGSHIKGLLVNFFHTFWPELLRHDPAFITTLATPIIKATKGKKDTLTFYNISEYEKWKKTVSGNWKIKYYKGLGTSTREEAKECFKDFNKKYVDMSIRDAEDDNAILLAFEKKYEDQRKEWIQKNTGKELFLDVTHRKISMSEFFNQEFVNFSIYDCERSIPNLMDGLKPSQRKVLYGALTLKLNNEKKVFELCGEISSRTAYHHGDKSMNDTIVGMAQDFVGSNNVNFLEPVGQFGSRLQGGDDAASPRYIFTKLNKITRLIFKQEDDSLLDYNDDDGRRIEPVYFWPCIPMLLINGAVGIGTGYSTNIPSHNPKDIIKITKELIRNKDYIFELTPWYRGFKGTIVRKQQSDNWISRGVYKKTNRNTIEITELPVGMWTEKYIEFLDGLLETDKINNYINKSDDLHVNISIVMDYHALTELIEKNTVYDFFKLETVIKASNLTFFNEDRRLMKVKTTEEIFFHFIRARDPLYRKRYDFLKEEYENELAMLNAKISFIKEVIADTIKVYKVSMAEVESQLSKKKYPTVDDSYEYLLSIKISSFTKEKIDSLENDAQRADLALKTLLSKTYKDLWFEDIDSLEKEF